MRKNPNNPGDPGQRWLGGADAWGIIDVDLRDWRGPYGGGYDPERLDRHLSELLEITRPAGLAVRLKVWAIPPCEDFPPPFGPGDRVEIVATEPRAGKAWLRLVGRRPDPDAGLAA